MFYIGLVLGMVIMGFVANRRPNWFANVVKAANAVDDKVNASVKGI